MQNRCWGITRNIRRCGRIGEWLFFCDDHKWQPLGWLFSLVFVVLSGLASILSWLSSSPGAQDSTNTIRQTPSIENSILAEEFKGPNLNTNVWHLGSLTNYDKNHQGVGSTRGLITQANGVLNLSAYAQHERGWRVERVEWVDSVLDFKKVNVPVRVDIHYSCSNSVGSFSFLITQDAESTGSSISNSIALLTYSDIRGEPLTMDRTQAIIELSSPGNWAITYSAPEKQILHEDLKLVDLSNLARWHLRFYVSASSSTGYASGRIDLLLHRVAAYAPTNNARIVGQVFDNETKKPIEGADISNLDNGEEAETNSEGLFLLRVKSGDNRIHVHATGYRDSDGPERTFFIVGRELIRVSLPMDKIELNYGEPRKTIRLHDPAIHALSICEDQLFYLADPKTTLYTRSLEGKKSVQIGNVEPAMTGLTCVGSDLYGVATWFSRGLWHIDRATGRTRRLYDLSVDYPLSLTCDGTNFWFLERDDQQKRYGIHCIRKDSGEPVVFVSSEDSTITGIAYSDGKLCVSSEQGIVYELDTREILAGHGWNNAIKKRFSGKYVTLAFDAGRLWATSTEGQRFQVHELQLSK